MRFSLLGTLLVEAPDGTAYELGGAKPRRLLALLVARRGGVVTVDELIDVLWGDDPPPSATNALHVQISKLRRALGVQGETMPLRTVHQGYVLDAAPGDVDVSRFERLLHDGTADIDAGDLEAGERRLDQALDLWRGPALADFVFDDFAVAERTRLEELRATAQEHRIEALLDLGRHGEVVPELEVMVAAAPLRERRWAQLMLALYRCGRQADALRTFSRARAHLIDELGIEPGAELRALERRILGQDPGLAGAVEPAPGPGPSTRRLAATNLRPELSSFVGRRDELAAIGALVAERRLVSIVGPGGVGKTRLATEIALRHDAAGDGAWLLELQAVSGAGAVARAFLSVFGGRLDGAGTVEADVTTVVEGVAAMIGRSALLLVLDNCEHVVAEAALAAAALLRACPNVHVLATSRVVLDVPGEAVRQLRPLEIEDAVDLFGSRGYDAQDGFAVDPGNVDTVRSICERVDRLPLGIELAAARLRAFTPSQLDARLADRLGAIGGSSPTRVARHQTMPATVAWSYDLLFDDERTLLRQLSVFRGSFTLDATVAVAAGDGGDTGDTVEVADTLARLVDKSLVVADGAGPESRYRLLRTVADFAAERAEELGEAVGLRDRHAAWIGDLAEQSWDGIRGPDHARWAQRLRDEAANVFAAATWLQDGGDPVLGMRIGGHLGWFTFTSTVYPAVLDALLACIAKAPDAPRHVRARAMGWAGLLGVGLPGTGSLADDAIAVAREEGDAGLLSEVILLAAVPMSLRRPLAARAIELVREARGLAVAAGEAWWAVSSHTLEGAAHMMSPGELPTAAAAFRTAARGFVELGDLRSAEIVSTYLSQVLEDLGDLDAAEDVLAPFATGRDASVSVGAITARCRLAWIAGRRGDVDRQTAEAAELLDATAVLHRQVARSSAAIAYGLAKLATGELDEARDHLTQALDLHERLGFERDVIIEHAALGRVAALQDRHSDSRRHHDTSIELGRRFDMPLPLAISLDLAATSALERGDALDAAELHGWSAAIRAAHGLAPTDHEAAVGRQLRERAAGAAGPAAVAAALERGEHRASTPPRGRARRPVSHVGPVRAGSD